MDLGKLSWKKNLQKKKLQQLSALSLKDLYDRLVYCENGFEKGPCGMCQIVNTKIIHKLHILAVFLFRLWTRLGTKVKKVKRNESVLI